MPVCNVRVNFVVAGDGALTLFSSIRRTAAAAFAAKSYDEAAAILAKKSAADPDNFSVLLSWANALSHAGRSKEAATVIERAAALMDRIEIPVSSMQTLLELAGANAPAATRRRIAEHLLRLHPDDDVMALSVLAMEPLYRDQEWLRKLSAVGERILADPDSTTRTLDLLCQLASGANNTAMVYASSSRLAVAVPEERRHLLTLLRSTAELGAAADPQTVLTAVSQRQPLPAEEAELLLGLARTCELTGKLELALQVYRLLLDVDARRELAIEGAQRLTSALHGEAALREFATELARRFPNDKSANLARLNILRRIGDREEQVKLTDALHASAPEDLHYLAYHALAHLADDEAAAAAAFKKIWQADEQDLDVVECLHAALAELLRQGRNVEDFLARMGFSKPHVRSLHAMAVLLHAIEDRRDLQSALARILGSPWTSENSAVLLSEMRWNAERAADQTLIREVATATVQAHGAFAEHDRNATSLSLGLLHNAACGPDKDGEAAAALARFNARPPIATASHDWTRPRWVINADRRLALWRQLAEQAPSDPTVQGELFNARRAATPPILFSGMPRAGSVFIYHALVRGMGKAGVGGVMAGAFPNFTLCQEGFQLMLFQRATSHTHLGPTEFNMREISQRYHLDRMYIHVRDPRQALLSWHDFLPGVLTSLDPTQAFHYRMPSEYLDWNSDQQLDWLVDNWLPVITDWIVGWARAPEQDYFKTEILFTTFEEMVADQTTFFNRILDFYGIDRDLFTPPEAKRGVSNYRKGDTHTWRKIMTPSQQRRAAEIVPAWLIERFNWPAG